MLRSPLLIALLLVFAAFGALGILWIVRPLPRDLAPVATLAPTVVATSTAAPSTTAEPDAYTLSVKLAAHVAITLVLPAPWQQLDLTKGAWRDTLSRLPLEDQALERRLAVENMLAALDPDSSALVAVLNDNLTADAAALPRLTVMMLPRNGLVLERYLEEVSTMLSRGGVVVYESTIDHTVRMDGLPVAALHYKLESVGALAVDGQQMATFSRDGTQLILFTFTTPQARYAELLPAFKQIVGAAHYQ